MAGIHWGHMKGFPVVTRSSAVAFALLVASVLLLSPASPATGHNVVEQRIPAPDSVVTQSPVDVSIATDGSFLDLGGEGRGFAIIVRDSAGMYFGNGCVDLNEGRMTTSVDLGEAGTYELAYQFVSADGHSLAENYEFTFAPEGDHRASQGHPTPPECGVEPGSATVPQADDNTANTAPTSSTVSATEANANGWVVGAGIAATVVALALLVMIRRSSRSTNRR